MLKLRNLVWLGSASAMALGVATVSATAQSFVVGAGATSNLAVEMISANSSLTVGAAGTLSSTNATTTVSALNSGTITNNGTIVNNNGGAAIVAAGSATMNNLTITNNNGGTITGTNAIRVTTGAAITNLAGGVIRGQGGDAIIAGTGATFSVNNSGSISSTHNAISMVTGTATITNNSGGTIVGGTNGINAANAANLTVSNSGTISGNNGHAIAYGGTNGTSNITNNAGGVLTGSSDGIQFTGNGNTNTVTNNGTISGTAAGTGIWIGGNSTHTITNNSGILGGVGINFSAGQNATITNNANGTITGTAGHGVDLAGTVASLNNSGTIVSTNAGSAAVNASGTEKTITNSGTINGSGTNGVGVRMQAGSLTNSGTIRGNGTGAGLRFVAGGTVSSVSNSGTIINATGTAVDATAGAFTTFTNTGTISGTTAIDSTGNNANLTFGNSGTINGNVALAQNSILNLTGGSVNGNTSGAGTVRFNATNFTSNGNFAISNLAVQTGTTNFAAANTITTGANGGLTIASGARAVLNNTTVGAHNIATLTNTGTLAIGSNGPVTLTGSLVTQNGSTVELKINGNTNTGNGFIGINGGGNATIANGTRLFANVTNGTLLTAGTQLSAITGAAALTVNVAQITAATNSLLYSFTPNVNGNDLRLQVAIDENSVSRRAQRGSEEVRGLGALMQQSAAGTVDLPAALDTVFTAVGDINRTQGAAAADEATVRLTPNAGLGDGGVAAINAGSNGVGGNIETRMAALRDGRTGIAAGDMVGRGVSLWATPIASWLDQDRKDGIDGFESDTWGLSGGFDTGIADHVRAGLALGYTASNVDSKGARRGDNSDVDGWQVSAYGSYEPSAWYVDGQLSYGWNNIEGVRNTGAANGNLIARSDYDATMWGARVSTGYGFDMGGSWSITPHAGLAYQNTEFDGYTETGANAGNLIVNSRDENNVVGNIGVRFNGETAFGSGKLQPELRLGYGHNFGDKRTSTSSRFVNTGANAQFATQGAERERSRYTAGLGATWSMDDSFSLTGDYDFTGTGSSDAHTGRIRARFNF